MRLFGNLDSNRYQYNLAYFAMLEKDTNSGLNTLAYRNQQVMIANLYRQDFIKPGYTIQVSFHYDKDDPSFQYDTNNFLVRPAPIGLVMPHSIRAYYYGLTGDGHFGQLNLTHAFLSGAGHTTSSTRSPDAASSINAQMAAVELSLDKDWLRYRAVVLLCIRRQESARWHGARLRHHLRQSEFRRRRSSVSGIAKGIRLTGTGVGLVSPGSLVPDLRTSKTEGQANFVNPGLFLYNAGVDIDITPKLRGFVNLNLIRFAHTEPLELLLFQIQHSRRRRRRFRDRGRLPAAAVGEHCHHRRRERAWCHSRVSAISPPIEFCSRCSRMSASASKTIGSGWLAASIACVFLCALLLGQQPDQSRLGRSQEEADRNSTGCVACHGQTDSPSMHTTGTVRLGCTDCHGGNADVHAARRRAERAAARTSEAKKQAHPKPQHSRDVAQFGQSGAALHRVAEGDQGIHPVRQSGRPARGATRPAARPAATPRKCARCAPA